LKSTKTESKFDSKITLLTWTQFRLKHRVMAERINNFKRLMEDEYENRFQLPQMNEVSLGRDYIDSIEETLLKKHASLRLSSDVTDLFLPKMFRTVMGLFGGEVAPKEDASHSRPAPDWGHSAPTQPKAPGQR
jgi:hypothetical protein